MYIWLKTPEKKLFASSFVVVDFDFVIKPLPRLGGLNYKLPFLDIFASRHLSDKFDQFFVLL